MAAGSEAGEIWRESMESPHLIRLQQGQHKHGQAGCHPCAHILANAGVQCRTGCFKQEHHDSRASIAAQLSKQPNLMIMTAVSKHQFHQALNTMPPAGRDCAYMPFANCCAWRVLHTVAQTLRDLRTVYTHMHYNTQCTGRNTTQAAKPPAGKNSAYMHVTSCCSWKHRTVMQTVHSSGGPHEQT